MHSCPVELLEAFHSSSMKIVVAPPDPTWPLDFARVKSELEIALHYEGANHLSIEHIGSTAIPNLPAKPVIDIVIIIE